MHEMTSAGSAAELHELPLQKLREFSPLIGEDAFAALRLEDAPAPRRAHVKSRVGSGAAHGGTGAEGA